MEAIVAAPRATPACISADAAPRRRAASTPVFVLAGLLALAFATPAPAAPATGEPLLLYASNVSKAAIEPLVPFCARAAATAVQARYANNPAVAQDIAAGTRLDVAIIETHMLEDLARKSFVAKSSIRPLAASMRSRAAVISVLIRSSSSGTSILR